MLSLKQYNASQLEAFGAAVAPLAEPRATGIACDGCGAELVDCSNEEAAFQMASPPRRRVQCTGDGCGWHGWRVMWTNL